MIRRDLPQGVVARRAIVYVRQSTSIQVTENLESQRRQTELRLEDLRATIRLEIDQARTDYRTATARSVAARASAAAAREALRVARESYEQGVANHTDLLDAQSRSTQAETVAVASFYEALIQASRLARAVGKLPTAGWSPSPEN